MKCSATSWPSWYWACDASGSASPAMELRSFAAQSSHYFAREHVRVPSKPLLSAAAWRGSELRQEWRADTLGAMNCPMTIGANFTQR